MTKVKVRCPACGNEENFSMVKEESRYDASMQIFVPIEKGEDRNEFVVCNDCGSDVGLLNYEIPNRKLEE